MHGSCTLGRKLYVYGGRHNFEYIHSLEVLDLEQGLASPTTLQWVRVLGKNDEKTLFGGRSYPCLSPISDTEIVIMHSAANAYAQSRLIYSERTKKFDIRRQSDGLL